MCAYITVLLARRVATEILVGCIFTEILASIDFRLRGWGFGADTERQGKAQADLLGFLPAAAAALACFAHKTHKSVGLCSNSS